MRESSGLLSKKSRLLWGIYTDVEGTEGGARPGAAGAEKIPSVCGTKFRTVPTRSKATFSKAESGKTNCEDRARPCTAPAQFPAWRKDRSDSSISGRMACRSSVADITGKSRISAQPRTQTNMSGWHDGGDVVRCRHSKKPGTSKESQQRLRKSSIQTAGPFWQKHQSPNPVQLIQENQDSTDEASDLRAWRLKSAGVAAMDPAQFAAVVGFANSGEGWFCGPEFQRWHRRALCSRRKAECCRTES